MGDEMYYRYQQYLIDEATTTVATVLHCRTSAPIHESKP
jgi:hypothetical protein